MATEALKNSINIPPTGYVNQGTEIMVFVARDVDFSGLYENVTVSNRYWPEAAHLKGAACSITATDWQL